MAIASICVPLRAGLAADRLLAVKGMHRAGMPTVGRYLSTSGVPNGDCSMVLERRCDSS
jgi:hypothetical protein